MTLRPLRDGWFALMLDGRELSDRQRFRLTLFEECGRCGKGPPTYVPYGDSGLMAMCEGCIVDVLSVMVFAAESAIEKRERGNGQG